MRNLAREEALPLAGVREWCRGRFWPLRLLLWGWFVYLLTQYLRNPAYCSFLGGLNLGIHELGHLICAPLGEFAGVAGGSVVQCLVPVISLAMFYRQEDYFAFSFSFVWLGSNLFGVATYIADARTLQLDLVSPFGGGEGEIIHDWNYLLHHLGLLSHETLIAACFRAAAIVCLVAGVVWGGWVLWQMISSPKREIGENWTV